LQERTKQLKINRTQSNQPYFRSLIIIQTNIDKNASRILSDGLQQALAKVDGEPSPVCKMTEKFDLIVNCFSLNELFLFAVRKLDLSSRRTTADFNVKNCQTALEVKDALTERVTRIYRQLGFKD